MMTIQVVSDISMGSESHGNAGCAFCFKLVSADKVLTFSGRVRGVKTPQEGEGIAVHMGILTALSLYPQARQIISNTDNTSVLGAKKKYLPKEIADRAAVIARSCGVVHQSRYYKEGSRRIIKLYKECHIKALATLRANSRFPANNLLTINNPPSGA